MAKSKSLQKLTVNPIEALIPKVLSRLSWVAPWLAGRMALMLFTTPRRIARPEWEKELIANGGETIRFPNGTQVTSWGQASAPAVLLVHGWQGRGTQLGKLVEPLLERGYRVIAWDGPGHGASEGRRSNVKLFAEALGEVGRAKGPVAGVIAHSLGAGATTLALARGWLQAKRVVLVGAPSEMEWILHSYMRRLRFSPKGESSFRRQLNAYAGIEAKEIRTEVLRPQLKVPALVIHDPEDQEVPFREAELIVKHWPGAQLLTLTGVGHRKILRAPEFIEAAVAFISAREN